MPECSGAPNESKPAKLNSRPITASCANVPPAPPYSSGIAGQRSPAAPALFQTSRSYRPSSFQVSRCGTYSAAMKRRACSSSSTRSSVIQPGRGTLRTFMRNPVDRTAYRAPLHYARATSVDKRLALFHNRRVAESQLANHLGLVPAMPEAGWQRLRTRSPRQPHHLRLGRLSAVEAAASDDRTNADLAAPLAPCQGDDLAHPLPHPPNRAIRGPAQPRACHDAS